MKDFMSAAIIGRAKLPLSHDVGKRIDSAARREPRPDLLAQVLFSHMIAAAFVTFGNWDCRLQLGGISGTSRPQDVECHTGVSSGV